MTTKKTQVIIPAAGLGERLQSDCIKPFIQVNQKTNRYTYDGHF